MSALCHAYGIIDRIYKGKLIAGSLAGKGEAGTVINTGADDGETEGDINTFNGFPFLSSAVVYKTNGFQGDHDTCKQQYRTSRRAILKKQNLEDRGQSH